MPSIAWISISLDDEDADEEDCDDADDDDGS